jgi:hypothetical protein
MSYKECHESQRMESKASLGIYAVSLTGRFERRGDYTVSRE